MLLANVYSLAESCQFGKICTSTYFRCPRSPIARRHSERADETRTRSRDWAGIHRNDIAAAVRKILINLQLLQSNRLKHLGLPSLNQTIFNEKEFCERAWNIWLVLYFSIARRWASLHLYRYTDFMTWHKLQVILHVVLCTKLRTNTPDTLPTKLLNNTAPTLCIKYASHFWYDARGFIHLLYQ